MDNLQNQNTQEDKLINPPAESKPKPSRRQVAGDDTACSLFLD